MAGEGRGMCLIREGVLIEDLQYSVLTFIVKANCRRFNIPDIATTI